MSQYRRVARLSDLAAGSGVVRQVGQFEIALFQVDGTVYAVENACCHRGGPLGHGELQGGVVRCPWHLWEFDLSSGACLSSPGERIRTYEVRIEGDEVFVAL